MGIENKGYTPPEALSRKMEFQGKSYEIKDVNTLHAQDIGKNDRVFITTQSGNRYMIRWSKSKGVPMIYSEREQFKNGKELANNYADGKAVAEIGIPMEYITVTNKEQRVGTKQRSSQVTAIEIRKDIDDAIEHAASETNFSTIATSLKNQFHEKPKT